MIPVDWSRIRYFVEKECACHCCGIGDICHDIMEKADTIRKFYGHPIIVLSGVRCTRKNSKIFFDRGESARDSYHIAMPHRGILGMALDIRPLRQGIHQLSVLHKTCLLVFKTCGGVIRYDNFIHIDCRPDCYRARR